MNTYVDFDPNDDKQGLDDWVEDNLLRFNRRLLVMIVCSEAEPAITQLSAFQDKAPPKAGTEHWAQPNEDNNEAVSQYLPLAK